MANESGGDSGSDKTNANAALGQGQANSPVLACVKAKVTHAEASEQEKHKGDVRKRASMPG